MYLNGSQDNNNLTLFLYSSQNKRKKGKEWQNEKKKTFKKTGKKERKINEDRKFPKAIIHHRCLLIYPLTENLSMWSLSYQTSFFLVLRFLMLSFLTLEHTKLMQLLSNDQA
jgi:hypothetical protein